MRIVTLEEHFYAPELLGKFELAAAHQHIQSMPASLLKALADVGEERLAAMDQGHVTVQVLSVAGAGAEHLGGAAGVQLARAYNDLLKDSVRRHPNRLAGFAHLPMQDANAAADELERAVQDLGFHGALINGSCEGLFLDHPKYEPLLKRAEVLAAPLYLHPALPPEPVRKAYYDGLPGEMGTMLSAYGFGWHIEVAIHVLRLAVSGAFSRHPGLQIVIGHMGETLPFMLDRSHQVFARQGLDLKDLLQKHVWLTTSGFFTLPPFLNALQTFGADRILYSVDYPFSSTQAGWNFLQTLPVSAADLKKIAATNADRLLRLNGASPQPHL